jgi:hypothetical protein
MSLRFSKTLTVGAASLALFWISVGIISMGVVRQPWDLIVVVLLLYICPIAGMFAALSFVKDDLNRGVGRLQVALGVLLSVGFFAYFLLVMSHL